MYEVKIFRAYETLPEDIKYELDIDDDYQNDILAIYKYGKLDRVETDGYEPEDAIFSRDLAWIKPALEQAYEQGKEDAYIEQNK